MTTNRDVKKNALCNTCTLKLVSIAYRRAPWFRLFREPLKLGMRFLSWIYRVNPAEYEVRTPNCFGCIRFYKVALKEKSGLFRWMNDRFNPLFDALLERIVTEEEIKQAKTYALSATAGEITPDEAAKWMQGERTGFKCIRSE
ncbi:MAG: nitroreductase [Lentisphaerota bacterium]